MEKRKDNFIDYLREIPNYLAIFIVPVYFMTASPMLLEIGASTGNNAADLSLIFTFFTIGMILGQLTSVMYNRKFKKFKVIMAGYVLIVPILFLLSLVNNLYLFYILYFLLGYAAGVIWIQATKYVLENKIKNKDRLTTIFLSFYPIGNFIAPLIASLLINNSLNWRYSYYIMIFLTFIIMALYIWLKRGKKGQPEEEEEERISLKDIFTDRQRNIIFVLGCLLLLFYCISETVVATWAPTFLRVEKLFDVNTAGWAASLFWLAVLIGRMITGAIAGKIKSNYIMLILSIIAIVSMAVFIPLNQTIGSLAAIFMAGIGCSGIITLGISSTSTIYPHGRGVLASIVFAAVNIGVSAAPFLTRLTSQYHMSWSMAIAPIAMGMTTVMILVKIFYTNKIKKYPGG
ncbi:MAG: MFS transporter [Actinomycetota bacterium]|nr:MFS transporter [Actinomycetota bacterium]